MDKNFALADPSERFVSSVAFAPEAALEVKPASRCSLATVLLCGVAVLSLALAIGSPDAVGGSRGELSTAIEVIGEAIDAERQGAEY